MIIYFTNVYKLKSGILEEGNMKRNYVKPVFVAECYSFNSSIAKCQIDIDTIAYQMLQETKHKIGYIAREMYGKGALTAAALLNEVMFEDEASA